MTFPSDDPRSVEGYEDPVNHPKHYTHGSAECIDIIWELGLGEGFCLGNAFKYLWRRGHKGKPVEDVKKAKFYIDYYLSKTTPEIKYISSVDSRGRMPVKPFLQKLKGGPFSLYQILNKVILLGWRHQSTTPTSTIRKALNKLNKASWIKSSGSERKRMWEFL